jgi:GT2 family glycosyltransferase
MSHTAVVILNYNGAKLLKQFLPSVIQHTQVAEIIVADNGSTDESLSIIRQDFPSIKIIEFDKNYGFCGGYNRALKQIDSDYYVLLNSDVEVTSNWLEPMIKMLDSTVDIAAVQPKILSFNEPQNFEYAGAAGGFIDKLGYPFCRGRIFNTVEKDLGQYNTNIEIFWATGACLMIRSDIYHQFNGLDEDFFAHMEEIDLCWKIHRINKKIFACGESTIYHLGAGTLGYANPRKTFLNFRNGLSLLYKHLDDEELVSKIILRMFLDWTAAGMFLLKGELSNCSAVFKAHFSFITHLNNNRIKRTEIHSKYPAYDRRCISPQSILKQYYLKGKRTFSALNYRT